MKHVILINLLVWICFSPVLAQGSGYRPPKATKGYIYLKDGTVLKGKYHYSPDFEKIRVTANGESRVYNASEVEKTGSKGPLMSKEEFVYSPRKFTSITEAGLLIGGPDSNPKTPFVLSTSLNYTLTDGLSAGIGTGVEFYHGTYLPVTANIHYRLGTKRISPFASVQAGYLIVLESNYYQPNNFYYTSTSSYYPYDIYNPNRYEKLDAQGGFMINPSVGVIIETDYDFGISLSVGYRYHRLKYSHDKNDYKLNVDYNRLSLKLGIIF